jgi:cytochrome P450
MDPQPTLTWLRERFPSVVKNPFWQLFATGSDPYGFLDMMRRESGDLFKFSIPGLEPAYVVGDPDAVRQILTGSYEDFGRSAGGVDLFLGPGSIIMQDDEPHKVRRKLLNPGFNAESVRGYGPVMLDITQRTLSRHKQGDVFPMLNEMADITLRVIIRCVFGVEEGPQLERLRKLVIEYLQSVFGLKVVLLGAALGAGRARALLGRLSERARRASLSDPPEPSRLPLLDTADRLGAIRGILDAEIDRCLADGPEKRRDVLAMMLQIRFEDGQPMTRSELIEQLITLLIGGYETTSITLTWAIHCLLQHPEAMAKARAEAKEAVRQGFDGTRVRDLAYIGAVMNEAMRVYPIAIAVTRRLRKPMTINGRELPVGALVSPSIYLVQRNRDLYPDADKFIPERMLEKRPPPHLFFPFGAGAWRCLGAAFAEHEMRVVMTHLLSRFELSAADREPVRPVQRSIVVGPSTPVLVRVDRIDSAPARRMEPSEINLQN